MHYAIIILCVFIAGYAFNSFVNKNKSKSSQIATSSPTRTSGLEKEPVLVLSKKINTGIALFNRNDRIALLSLLQQAINCDHTIKDVTSTELDFLINRAEAYGMDDINDFTEIMRSSVLYTPQSLIEHLYEKGEIIKQSLFEIQQALAVDGKLNVKEHEFINELLSYMGMDKMEFVNIVAEYHNILNEETI